MSNVQLTHDRMIAAIHSQHPQLVHGSDFWVFQKVKLGSSEPLAEPFISDWLVEDIVKPTFEQCLAWDAALQETDEETS